VVWERASLLNLRPTHQQTDGLRTSCAELQQWRLFVVERSLKDLQQFVAKVRFGEEVDRSES